MTLYKRNRLVVGVGINDADYNTYLYVSVDGKRKVTWICPFFSRWSGMLERCYSKRSLEKRPAYAGCSVCEEWLTFSNFRGWMEQQDWEGKQLDKDILLPGNKEYGPDVCVFVSQRVNLFLTERKSERGIWPIGVYYDTGCNKYSAQCCSNTGRQKKLGKFNTPEEAFSAWLAFKLQQAYTIASEQTDIRVAKALIDRYENYVE